VFLTGYSAPLP